MKKFHLFFLLLLMAIMVPQAARAEYYGIKVAGVSVTSDNCDNITGDKIKTYRSKTFNPDVSWVRYNPSTKTLTLHNIQIERSGSGNRAILNESCDGLTINFEIANRLEAVNASPVRLNANTTITSTEGLYGEHYHFIKGRYEDAITISNGAQLNITDIRLDVTTPESTAILGNTGNEKLNVTNAYVEADGVYAMKDIASLFVDGGSLTLFSNSNTNNLAVINLKEFNMGEQMGIGIWRNNCVSLFYYGRGYYNPTVMSFLTEIADEKMSFLTICKYVPLNEQTFPDETFRNIVSEKIDENGDGKLDFLEILNSKVDKSNDYNLLDKGISSLKGIEHLPFQDLIYCAQNNLTYLDLRYNPCLTNLKCYDNQITTLRLSEHPKLETINCSNNLITNIDFSGCPNLKDIDISGNRIDGWMTDVLESLPDVTGIEGEHKIKIGDNKPNDNVCSDEQANIAKNKGWNVTLGGVDSEGNIVYDVQIGGHDITSANADDLTVLPGVTKNDIEGYARYNPTTNTLYLNDVDIVNQNGRGININTENTDFTIILGQEPVNITSSGTGIYARVNTLTITTAEDWWYREKLKITSEAAVALNVIGNVVLDGVTRIEAIGAHVDHATYINGKLYVKNDAELRIKALHDIQLPIWPLVDLVLENDNIIVTPAGAYFDSNDRRLMNANGTPIWGKEVVIGKLREYQYYVAGTRISNANQHDVLGNGTVVFQEPAFNGGAGTLILNNANIEAGSASGISASKALYIKLEGENTINSTTRGLEFSKPAYIQGPGSLYVKGQYGIDAHLSKLFISDGAQVTAEGTTRYAIDGQETTISGENTVVSMKCSPEARGTFRASTSLTLNDGLKIDTPEGAQYVDGEIKDASGNVIKDEWVTIEYTEAYDITVAGIGVTNHNMNDVLGDGTVSYDPETNTLTLNGANIETTRDIGLLAKRADLKVNLIGENSIRTSDVPGLQFRKASEDGPVTFMGGGSLNVTSDVIGMQLYIDAVLTDGVQVTVESTSDTYAAMQGRNSGSGLPTITVSGEGTVLGAKGGTLGSVANFSALALNDGLEITKPAGATFVENVGIIANGTLVANEWVTISKPAEVQTYDLYIAGIQVSTENQEDVLGDGTVSFDPETNTLTLNNANIETEAEGEGLSTQIDEVIIKLEGENSIEAPEGYGIYSDASFTITGPGSLSVTSKFEALNGSFVIEGGAKVTADSQTRSALWSFYPLAVSGSETVVMLKGAKGAVEIYGADSEEAVLSLSDGLVLGLPEGVHCGIVDVLVDEEEDMWIPYGYILDANDNNITDQWVIIASEDYIDGIASPKSSPEGKDLIYNLAGQKVGNGYKGIVIVGGKKLLKK